MFYYRIQFFFFFFWRGEGGFPTSLSCSLKIIILYPCVGVCLRVCGSVYGYILRVIYSNQTDLLHDAHSWWERHIRTRITLQWAWPPPGSQLHHGFTVTQVFSEFLEGNEKKTKVPLFSLVVHVYKDRRGGDGSHGGALIERLVGGNQVRLQV